MKYILLSLLLLPAFALAQKPVFTTARATNATVYFSSAEITQTASVQLPKGTGEIVVKNVADYINENTIQIGAPASLTVLSVQFTNNYISEYEPDENAPAIIKVRDSIKLVEKEIQRLTNAMDSEAKAIELIDKNQRVSGAANGLNLAELMKVVDYYRAKRTELGNAYDALEEKIKQQNLKLTRLKNKLETDTKNEEKTSKGKLVIQVMNETAGLVPLSINYMTPRAWWNPFYDLRTNSISDPIDMVYKAQVSQDTGIDWKQVKLTLSSGNPNQNNEAPRLESWFLHFTKREGVRDIKSDVTLYMNSMQGVVPGIAVERDGDFDGAATGANEIILKRSLEEYTTTTENQLNVSFDIDIPYDILANGKAHSVALSEVKLPATYKYYAVPRLDNEAFLLAEIRDYGKYNLLPGEANIIFEGMYVGKTYINPNQTGDTLNLSMGRDKKISIKREKIADKSGTKFLSSKKEQTFTYDITIRNNKKDEAKILLKDQYPLSTDKDIEVSLLESDGAKVGTETGILTWELNLKPNEIKKIRISYKVRYPKDRVLGNL